MEKNNFIVLKKTIDLNFMENYKVYHAENVNVVGNILEIIKRVDKDKFFSINITVLKKVGEVEYEIIEDIFV